MYSYRLLYDTFHTLTVCQCHFCAFIVNFILEKFAVSNLRTAWQTYSEIHPRVLPN